MSAEWRELGVRLTAGLVATAIPMTAVAAQDYPAAGYQQPGQQPPAGYDAAPRGYAEPPAAYDAPPPGYDGTRPPPPPLGYRPDPAYASDPDADRRYQATVEDWAQRYCVKSSGNTGAGALIGGLFGALLGSGIAGRGDHAVGAVIGGFAGAAGGAAIGSTSDRATSPGCPPGYVVRGGAARFVYDDGPYDYAAPDWYRPWIYVGERWTYRPYPYHGYYYRHYGYGYGPRGGFRGRGRW